MTTGRSAVHAIEATIGTEKVLICQFDLDSAFVFQSGDWRFRSRHNVETIALAGNLGNIRWREDEERQDKEHERQRKEAERRWLEAEERRQTEANRQVEANRSTRHAEPKDVPGVARQPEQQVHSQTNDNRHEEITAEAKRVLARLDAKASSVKSDQHGAITTPPPPPDSFGKSSASVNAEQIESLIGLLHQQSAESQIMERIDDLKQKYGVSLESAETMEDQSRLLVLRG